MGVLARCLGLLRADYFDVLYLAHENHALIYSENDVH